MSSEVKVEGNPSELNTESARQQICILSRRRTARRSAALDFLRCVRGAAKRAHTVWLTFSQMGKAWAASGGDDRGRLCCPHFWPGLTRLFSKVVSEENYFHGTSTLSIALITTQQGI